MAARPGVNMLALFNELKNKNIKTGSKSLASPTTEGLCNRFHYRFTVIILLGCSVLVTCLEWIGNGSKISCVLEGPEDDWVIPPNVINTYCFILKTFTLPKHYNSEVGEEVAYQGVGAFNARKDSQSFKAYYQWVPFVLFFQGILFYIPHYIFKSWEGGKVKGILSNLNTIIIDREDRTARQKGLAKYFVESLNTHDFWAIKMLFVEIMNLANVVLQIIFVDVFLGGEFSSYGTNVVNFLESDPENRNDPMSRVFPRVTKCSYFMYGPSGTIQTHDAICVLPINILNEKIYVFLWFWFIILAIISCISLTYHIVFISTPEIAKKYLKSQSIIRLNGPHWEEIWKRLTVGDRRLLYLLAKNMDSLTRNEFLRELMTALKDANDNLDHLAKPNSDKPFLPQNNHVTSTV